MKHLVEVILICCFVSASRSSEDVTSTLKSEYPSITTHTPTSTSTSTVISTPTKSTGDEDVTTVTTTSSEIPQPKQLPVDILSPDKVFLDPNVVLARVNRDTYGSWNQRQRFGNPYERRPFGIEGYYRMNRPNVPDRPRRRNSDVRRVWVTPKPFRVYPVFPG